MKIKHFSSASISQWPHEYSLKDHYVEGIVSILTFPREWLWGLISKTSHFIGNCSGYKSILFEEPTDRISESLWTVADLLFGDPATATPSEILLSYFFYKKLIKYRMNSPE
jgi:hypothetical protein